MQKNRKSSPHTIAHEEDPGLDIYGQKRFKYTGDKISLHYNNIIV